MTDNPAFPDAGPCQDDSEHVYTAWSSPTTFGSPQQIAVQFARCVKCGFVFQNQLLASAEDVTRGVEQAVGVSRMERFLGLFSRKG